MIEIMRARLARYDSWAVKTMILDDALFGPFTLPFEHGLLVVEDSATRSKHDSWDAATESVHVDGDSIYLAVQSSVDGQVVVEACDAGVSDDVFTGLVARFDGEIPLTSGVLRVCDSDNVAVLSLRVRAERIRVRVLVDDDEWSARVVVVLA
jgi:hypothetical protein